jgi:hypothetical protein
MTPNAASSLKVRESEVVNELALRRKAATATVKPAPWRDLGADIDAGGSALLWREALHRRLLGVADVTSAAVAAGPVLGAFDQRPAALSALAGAALVLFVFKLAGLYDRDDLRVARSTLDEVPLLAQLTGVFALGVAILQNIVLGRIVSAEQIAALWIVPWELLSVLGSSPARWLPVACQLNAALSSATRYGQSVFARSALAAREQRWSLRCPSEAAMAMRPTGWRLPRLSMTWCAS